MENINFQTHKNLFFEIMTKVALGPRTWEVAYIRGPKHV